MGLCWGIYERLPKEDCKKSFYALYAEKADIYCNGPWGLSEELKARVKEIDAQLEEISVEAPPPKKWTRKGADGWMGKDLTFCEEILGMHDDLSKEMPYNDLTPDQARMYAGDLKEVLREWQADHPGWWKRRDISDDARGEVRIIESAIRFLTRWAERGYCIFASY